MAQRLDVLLNDLAADFALVLGGPGLQAGGGSLGALDLNILVLVGVGLEVRRQHHAARVGVLGHRKADGRVAVTAAGAGRPARKDKALVGHGGHGAGGATLLDQLAGGAADLAAVCGDKFQRDLRAAHGYRVAGDKVRRNAVGLGDGPQRLRAAVLGDIGVGAHIVKVRCNGGF